MQPNWRVYMPGRCKQKHILGLALWLQILEMLLSERLWRGFWSSESVGDASPHPPEAMPQGGDTYFCHRTHWKTLNFLNKVLLFLHVHSLATSFRPWHPRASLTDKESEMLHMQHLELRELNIFSNVVHIWQMPLLRDLSYMPSQAIAVTWRKEASDGEQRTNCRKSNWIYFFFTSTARKIWIFLTLLGCSEHSPS